MKCHDNFIYEDKLKFLGNQDTVLNAHVIFAEIYLTRCKYGYIIFADIISYIETIFEQLKFGTGIPLNSRGVCSNKVS